MHYIFLFIYCMLMAFSYGGIFKKPFAQSLAPAFFIHILLCLFTGIAFGNVSLGIWGGICIAVIILVYNSIIKQNRDNKNDNQAVCSKNILFRLINTLNDSVLLTFLIIFICLVIINKGKYFVDWDEFSHWGMFLKETLRLDKLYCASPKDFAHKDYVPLVTLFEAIWCKLSFRFEEADAYRAVQVLQFSMILPIIQGTGSKIPIISKDSKSSKHSEIADMGGISPEIYIENTHKNSGIVEVNYLAVFICICKAAIIVLALLLIYPSAGQLAFHTVYQDIIYSFFIFYCVYAVFDDSGSDKYNVFVLILSLTMLVLVKMTAVFFLPMILGLYVCKDILAERGSFLHFRSKDKDEKLLVSIHKKTSDIETNKSGFGKKILQYVIIGGVPAAAWLFVNAYVKRHVQSGEIQSYGSIRLSSLIDVFTHNGSISYQNAVDSAFLRALSSPIFGSLSLKRAFVLIVAALFVLIFLQRDKKNRKKIILLDLWMFVTGVIYILLIYFLYCTQFAEVEAVQVVCFDRYMNSYLFAAILIILYFIFDSRSGLCNFFSPDSAYSAENSSFFKLAGKIHIASMYTNALLAFALCLILGLYLYAKFPERYMQLLTGKYGRDANVYNERMLNAQPILENTAEDINERIFCIICSDNYGEFNTLRYDTNPRTLDGGIIGPERDESFGWNWAWDLSKEEFVREVSKYEYMYFKSLDDIFMQTYSDVFYEPGKINERSLYKVSIEQGMIELKEVAK